MAMDLLPRATSLRARLDGRGVATLTLDRAHVRNAFDATLIGELGDAARLLGNHPDVRVVVLTGRGEAFCAGADVAWLRAASGWSPEEAVTDSARLETSLRTLYELPKPLIGRVNGHALGGGAGLVAVCDVAVASAAARLGFPEVRLGLVPAVIAPYVVRKVGRSFARAVFLTGEQFSAARAQAAGLVHDVVPREQLDAAVGAVVERCLRGGPRAQATAKRLPDAVLDDLDGVAARTTRLLADLRVSQEGQEGVRAFLEHRPPGWVGGQPKAAG